MELDASSSVARTSRRGFLAGASAAALTGMASNAQAAQAPAPLPRITIGNVSIPRMVVGCNPIGGWSHQVRSLTRAMMEYFDLPTTIAFLKRCEQMGLTTWLAYWDEKPLKALKTLWAQGSRLRPYFLGTLESSGTLSKDVLEYRPLFYCHHGNVTDSLFREGKQERVHDFVKQVHDILGIPAGISAHNPHCIEYAAEKGWEADFYQCCLYYVTRPKEEIRAKLGAAPLGEPFLDADRDAMLRVIRQVNKPCLAFKILGAGWHCDTDEAVEEAFRLALTSIKPTDGIIVGMWPKFKDEIAQNVALLRKYGTVRKAAG
jgi:hypothetical protein